MDLLAIKPSLVHGQGSEKELGKAMGAVLSARCLPLIWWTLWRAGRECAALVKFQHSSALKPCGALAPWRWLLFA